MHKVSYIIRLKMVICHLILFVKRINHVCQPEQIELKNVKVAVI